MSHLNVSGTPSPTKGCDPGRIDALGADGVTPPVGPGAAGWNSRSERPIDLLTGRYLHTTPAGCRHLSRTPVGNESPALSGSTTRPGSDEVPRETERRGYRNGWLAGDLSSVAWGGPMRPHRREAGTTELSATNRAERREISMAGPAPSDIGVAEVHESFTPADKISYEDVDFAEPAAVSVVTILEGPVTDGR
jgi:hypothetical protein